MYALDLSFHGSIEINDRDKMISSLLSIGQVPVLVAGTRRINTIIGYDRCVYDGYLRTGHTQKRKL